MSPYGTRGGKEYRLETTRPSEVKRYKQYTAELLKFHWDYYQELAYQRAQIQGRLELALIEGCTHTFAFDGWQRAVKYKYSLNPLNARGSLSDPGGRFNIGNIKPTNFPVFAALYIAEDKETAFQELLGQGYADSQQMSALELALTKKDSISIVEVRGELDQVFDLHEEKNLRSFLNLLKKFALSKSLLKTAAKLRTPCRVVKTMRELTHSILVLNWRVFPMWYDVPSNSQLFGQIASSANIQGILYPSKLSGKRCLAIFPQTFKNSSSFVELVEEPLTANVPKRVGASNYEFFC
jgi:hypothetical protein